MVSTDPGLARDLAFIAFSSADGDLVAKQITNYRWWCRLKSFSTAARPQRHGGLFDAAAP